MRALTAALLPCLARVTRQEEVALEPLLAAAVADFFPLYESRPVVNNTGGGLFNDSLCLYLVARLLAPRLIVESGSYQGHSAWLLRRACPAAEILSFDVDSSQLRHREPDVAYREGDWSGHPLPAFAPGEALNLVRRPHQPRPAPRRGACPGLSPCAVRRQLSGTQPLRHRRRAAADAGHDPRRVLEGRRGTRLDAPRQDLPQQSTARSHVAAARALIAGYHPLPDLTEVTRYQPPSAMTYVELAP